MIGTADYISLTTCRTFRANSGELLNWQEQVEYIRNCGKLTFPSAIGKLFYEKKSSYESLGKQFYYPNLFIICRKC
jgi:hypothetical protein